MTFETSLVGLYSSIPDPGAAELRQPAGVSIATTPACEGFQQRDLLFRERADAARWA